jgi:peptidoglycan/LPS O-acetylase OafA/YrhL
MKSNDSTAHRYEALDGWRGVCALAVALNHLVFAGYYRSIWAIANFHLFVDYFFVLSGFVISHAYTHRLNRWADVAPYMLRRLGRVYPLHFVTLATFVAYQAAQVVVFHRPYDEAFSGKNDPWYIVTNLLMLQGMGANPSGTWNGPSWSISVETYLYLAFALALLCTKRPSFPAVCLALSVVGAFVIRAFAPHIMDSTYDFGFARGLYGFFLGCIVYRVIGTRKPGRAKYGTIVEVAMVAAIGMFLSVVDRGYWAMLSTPIFAVAVWLFAQERGALSDALKGAVGRALGKWSFSIYLWHYVMLIVMFGGLKQISAHFGYPVMLMIPRVTDGEAYLGADFGTPILNDLAALAFLVAATAVGAFSYRFIERPGMRAFKRLADVIERKGVRAISTPSDSPAC